MAFSVWVDNEDANYYHKLLGEKLDPKMDSK